MPFINISTSTKVSDKKKLLEEVTSLISSLTKKSEKFIMVKLEDNLHMSFSDESPCCYLEIKSIGSLNPYEMTKPICVLRIFLHQCGDGTEIHLDNIIYIQRGFF